VVRRLLALAAMAIAEGVAAQSGGALYVAGAGFDFPQAADRALAQNPGSRFFLLAVGDAVRYLALTAPPEMVEVRNRAARGNVQFLVCERDITDAAYRIDDLVPGTVAVKGWPKPGGAQLPAGAAYYADEDPATLPASTETLRRLRATCS
jgi:hypothetical protein